MMRELGRRGAGHREAGAFLLASRNDRCRVRRVEYFDDLDPNCLNGNVHFDGRAFSRLWDICEREGLVVVGDVHTHPSRHVRQSVTDQDNPMVARAGHMALIVPELAVRRVRPRRVGVHQYHDDGSWMSWYGWDAAVRLSVRGWPWL